DRLRLGLFGYARIDLSQAVFDRIGRPRPVPVESKHHAADGERQRPEKYQAAKVHRSLFLVDSGQWAVGSYWFSDLRLPTSHYPLSTLNLNVDDLADDQPSDDLHDHASAQHVDAIGVIVKRLHIVWIDYVDPEEEEKRQRADDVSRQSGLGGFDPNLALDGESLADRMTDVPQHFGEVAADLALDEHRRHIEFEVENRHALDQIFKRRFHVQSEVLLFVGLAELARD